MKKEQKTFISRGMTFKISELGKFINLHYPNMYSTMDMELFVPTEKELSDFLGYDVICVDHYNSFRQYIKL